MRVGFIVGIPGILGFLLYRRWRKNRSAIR
jgi:hypothetical protein